MIKSVVFFKRKAGMPVDEFQAYWLTRHPGFRYGVVHVRGWRLELTARIGVVADRIAGIAIRPVERALAGALGVVAIDHGGALCIGRANPREDDQMRLNCSNGCRQSAQW